MKSVLAVNMDTIAEGSHEGMSTSSRKLSTREIEANAEMEKLKRENELLKTTKTRTKMGAIPDESLRTMQAREQLEQLRLENERLLSSKLAPSAPPMSSRTYQNLNMSIQNVQAEQETLRGGGAGYPVIAGYPVVSSALEHGSTRTGLAESKPTEVNASRIATAVSPVGMSSRTHQAMEELNALKQENENLKVSKLAPASRTAQVRTQSAPPGLLSSGFVQAVGDQKSRVSPRAVQALEELNTLKQENDKLVASKVAAPSTQSASPRTALALGDPKSRISPRTVQALEEMNTLKQQNDKLVASKVAAPSTQSASPRTALALGDPKSRISPRTVQALEEMNTLKQENDKLVTSKVAAPTAVSPLTAQAHGDSKSRVSPRAVQALEEMNTLKQENDKLIASKVGAPTAVSPRTAQASGEPSRISTRAGQALEELNALKKENEKLMASKVSPRGADDAKIDEKPGEEVSPGSFSFRIDSAVKKSGDAMPSIPAMSARTIAQIRNDPASVLIKTKSAPPGDVVKSMATPSGADVGTKATMSGADPSGRTVLVMEELAKVKRENELLKASKVDGPGGMSDRTRQVLDQLEKVKRENAMLKTSKVDASTTAQRRLAYLEQNHTAATKIRTAEIKKMILQGQELDLAFLVDATGSMQNSINMIKDTVTNMAGGIKEQYPECKMRVAFAPYRDYEDTVRDDNEACDFTTSFTGADSTFARALSRVRASGGGDDAEDVFTGIARVASFSWNATNRLVIHIGDAPCHGRRFHDGVGDHFPAGDKYGRQIENVLALLYEACHITTYYFCHLNTSTRRMLQEFKKAGGDKISIMEEQFENISMIPHKVVTLCRGTIQKTLSVVGAAHPADMKFVNEVVVTAVPSWDDCPIQTGSHFRHKWYRALDDLLSKINRKMALDEEVKDHIQVQIAKHPFSGEGAVRWPFYAMVTHPDEPPRFMVVKRFKTPLNKDTREVHKRDRYLAQMEVQSVSAQMAFEFNQRTSNFKNVKKVEFTQVTTLEVGGGPTVKYFNMEQVLEGQWIRYSNNGGYVNTSDYAAVLQAFTHWTHERSRGLLMVTDLQGVRLKNADGENVFCLCDPAIHCTDVMRFTRTNLGQEGFKLFFDTHKCNDVCKHLGLAVGTAGRTISGTRVDKYW